VGGGSLGKVRDVYIVNSRAWRGVFGVGDVHFEQYDCRKLLSCKAQPFLPCLSHSYPRCSAASLQVTEIMLGMRMLVVEKQAVKYIVVEGRYDRARGHVMNSTPTPPCAFGGVHPTNSMSVFM